MARTTMPTYADHPRLLVGESELARLRTRPKHPLPAAAWDVVTRDAERFASRPFNDTPPDSHNGHLLRARDNQTEVMTLIVRFLQTGDKKMLTAALERIAGMDRWTHWSWIAWREGLDAPDAIFDLSYGENSTTLALAYDLLHAHLTDEQREMMVDMARRRALSPFLKVTADTKNPPHWLDRPDSNWNAVCAGGAGMLALAMMEDAPEARKVLAVADRSVQVFFDYLKTTGGAWPEGIGYWNYGFRYGFFYMLSWEKALDRKHPALRGAAVKKSLRFAGDFCPNQVGCSFGDVSQWSPMPFHYAAAQRLGDRGLPAMLDQAMGSDPSVGRRHRWPVEAMLLLLHPGKTVGTPKPERDVLKVYKGLDWGLVADRMPDSSIYVSVRGGTDAVPHCHLDLMSFNLVVGDEGMLININPSEYLDSTFSPRWPDLFEKSSFSKNTILIDGVGHSRLTRVKLRTVRGDGLRGFLIDGTGAYPELRPGGKVTACLRLVLMLENSAVLIVDRIRKQAVGRFETRFHTYADVETATTGAKLKGVSQTMRMAFACNRPAVLSTAGDPHTTPVMVPAGGGGRGSNMNRGLRANDEATMIRWRPLDLHHEATMACLCSPGAGRAKVTLEDEGKATVARVVTRTLDQAIRLGRTLRPEGAKIASK